MKIAIVGSRDITVTNLGDYITYCDEIVSGGAKRIFYVSSGLFQSKSTNR